MKNTVTAHVTKKIKFYTSKSTLLYTHTQNSQCNVANGRGKVVCATVA